jgi:hypothetical protein
VVVILKASVFKEPKVGREAQIRSELLASYIAGDLLGWSVQHVSIAKRGDTYGNLMGYIFEDQDVFTEGWSFCLEVDAEYDVDRGERHTLPLLIEVGDFLVDAGLDQGDYLGFWAQAFAFDTLISNGDRHAENWAVISSDGILRMAPLYDNASSLGCECDETGLARQWFDGNGDLNLARVQTYIERGRHHVRLSDPARAGASYDTLCRRFLELSPEHTCVFESVAELDLQPVTTLLAELVALDTIPGPYLMTGNRARQIEALLISGRERIRNILK